MKYSSLLVVILLLGCGKEEAVDINNDITYSAHYPLTIGKTIDYSVESIIYSNKGSNLDTDFFLLREETVSSYVNDAGEQVYLIDVLRRKNQNEDWDYVETHTAGITRNEAIRTEGNYKYVKLKFPARGGEEWNGNKFFDDSALRQVGPETMDYFKNWQSRYLVINDSQNIDGQIFDGVHTVQLADDENKLELRYGIEQYAQDIGLIYKELRVLDTQCFTDCEAIPWAEKAEKGIIWIQKMIGHN